VLDPRVVRHLVGLEAPRPVLTDYQTRAIESAIATLRETLPALRDSLDNLASAIRQSRGEPDGVDEGWHELEVILEHLDLLERARGSLAEHTAGPLGQDDAAGPEVIGAVRSVELGKLLHGLHAIAGTPVEGYIAQESA
jgi:hypothetical protein